MVGASAWAEGMVVFLASRVSQEASNMVPMPATSKSKRFMKSFMRKTSSPPPKLAPIVSELFWPVRQPWILRRGILQNSSLQIPYFFLMQ